MTKPIDDNPLETQEDLQRFLSDLNATSETDSDVLSEGQEDVQTDEEVVESTPDENEGVPDTSTEESVDSDVEPADTKPVEDRFSELSKTIEPEAQGADEEVQLKQLETQLQVEQRQLQNADILAGLPNLTADGKSIYALEPNDLNKHLMQLRDSGQELQADQVSQAYNAACMRVQQYVQLQQQHQQKQQELKAHKDTSEWRQCRKQWLETLPEVETHIPRIAQHIDSKAQTDPATALLVETQAGKMRAILQAIRELGLDKELAKSAPKAEIKSPSAPDARAASKKVINKSEPAAFTRAQIAAMSQTEFEKNEPEIDRQMRLKLIK